MILYQSLVLLRQKLSLSFWQTICCRRSKPKPIKKQSLNETILEDIYEVLDENNSSQGDQDFHPPQIFSRGNSFGNNLSWQDRIADETSPQSKKTL